MCPFLKITKTAKSLPPNIPHYYLLYLRCRPFPGGPGRGVAEPAPEPRESRLTGQPAQRHQLSTTLTQATQGKDIDFNLLYVQCLLAGKPKTSVVPNCLVCVVYSAELLSSRRCPRGPRRWSSHDTWRPPWRGPTSLWYPTPRQRSWTSPHPPQRTSRLIISIRNTVSLRSALQFLYWPHDFFLVRGQRWTVAAWARGWAGASSSSSSPASGRWRPSQAVVTLQLMDAAVVLL